MIRGRLEEEDPLQAEAELIALWNQGLEITEIAQRLGIPKGTVHIPPDLVVKGITAHRKPPDVRICRLRNQSRVGTVPPSTSTPQQPAC